ncbi:hypothetical protein LIS04_169 [Listeria phage LIS04]|nr:hypothetical protein LIS04_169 [Listeria phage LIS04]
MEEIIMSKRVSIKIYQEKEVPLLTNEYRCISELKTKATPIDDLSLSIEVPEEFREASNLMSSKEDKFILVILETDTKNRRLQYFQIVNHRMTNPTNVVLELTSINAEELIYRVGVEY